MLQMTPEQFSDRLIAFSLTILAAVREMQSGRICNPLGDQIVRSATSSSLNYGEARSAESKKGLYPQTVGSSQRT